MIPDQRAFIGQDGRVFGQALVSQSFVLAPLHVIDREVPSSISLLDRRGNIDNVILSEVLAVDFASDMIMFRSTLSIKTGNTARLVSAESHCIDVEVHAIVDIGSLSKSASRMEVFPSAIRDIVEVERYSYLSASGLMTSARNLRVVFLSHPFPQGWSGAPVYLKGTYNIVGFIHGNAPANSGAGICLVPDSSSTLLKIYYGDT